MPNGNEPTGDLADEQHWQESQQGVTYCTAGPLTACALCATTRTMVPEMRLVGWQGIWCCMACLEEAEDTTWKVMSQNSDALKNFPFEIKGL
jgi:hypothetical protein